MKKAIYLIIVSAVILSCNDHDLDRFTTPKPEKVKPATDTAAKVDSTIIKNDGKAHF